MVFVNQNEFKIANNTSLRVFLDAHNFIQEGTAVAVNDTVIPKTNWEYFILNDKDQLMLIRATAGG